MIKLSLATNEIESFAGAINRARGTCWARACALVRDRTRLTETPVSVTALTHPVICSPLATPIGCRDYAHLQGLTFAVSVDASSDAIDILLGADYFFEIVTGEKRKGSAGPVAISSKLGWVISGPVDVAPKDANIYSNFVSCSIVDQHLVNEIMKGDADKFLQEQRVC